MDASEIHDLRSALAFLRGQGFPLEAHAGRLSPRLEIPTDYALRGGGVPSQHALHPAPPRVYETEGASGMPVLVGLMGRRDICAALLGLEPDRIAPAYASRISGDYPPVKEGAEPPCQEVVVEGRFRVEDVLPLVTHSPEDAGPYITLGLLYARDPETGEEDVTIHRMCYQGDNRFTVYFVPGRHIETLYLKALARGKALEVTVNIGLDPAIYLAAAFTYPTTPLGFNELNIAGSVRRRGVSVSRGRFVDAPCIAQAEVVLEGRLVPERRPENGASPQGYSLPEFLGYIGKAQPSLPVFEVKGITHRRKAIYQDLIGPGSEQSNILGIPTEASLYGNLRDSITDRLINVHCSNTGGGKLSAFLQFRKRGPADDAVVRQAGVGAFSAFHELKHVFLVDEDIDIFDERDVLWAMTTRFQADESLIRLPGLSGHPLDPSQSPEFSPRLREAGTTCKAVFDCTAPYRLKDKFTRADFRAR